MSGGGFRLDAGGLIDRSRPLSFTFDGKAYRGYAGDTLASALLANGVRIAGRSFKYHRPRGIVSAGHEEPNALVELRDGARREPNVKATTIELYDGLVASSQKSLALARLRRHGAERAAETSFRRGLLLQDLHVAGILLGESLRADHSSRGGSWPRQCARRSRLL